LDIVFNLDKMLYRRLICTTYRQLVDTPHSLVDTRNQLVDTPHSLVDTRKPLTDNIINDSLFSMQQTVAQQQTTLKELIFQQQQLQNKHDTLHARIYELQKENNDILNANALTKTSLTESITQTNNRLIFLEKRVGGAITFALIIMLLIGLSDF